MQRRVVRRARAQAVLTSTNSASLSSGISDWRVAQQLVDGAGARPHVEAGLLAGRADHELAVGARHDVHGVALHRTADDVGEQIRPGRAAAASDPSPGAPAGTSAGSPRCRATSAGRQHHVTAGERWSPSVERDAGHPVIGRVDPGHRPRPYVHTGRGRRGEQRRVQRARLSTW